MRTSRTKRRTFTFHQVLVVLVVVGCLLTGPTTVLAFSDQEAEQALEVAMQYVSVEYQFEGEMRQGVAYLYGGQDTIPGYLEKIAQGAQPGRQAGIDASGLVINVYRAIYPDLHFVQVTNSQERKVNDTNSKNLYLWNIKPLAPEELKPGDLVFFGTEGYGINGVALYVGRQGQRMQIVTASHTQGKVVVTGVRVGGDYWKHSFAGAGRLIKR